MSFGSAKGVDFAAFCSAVQLLTYRTKLSNGEEIVVELPLEILQRAELRDRVGGEVAMFEYLKPKDGPVFDGLEAQELVYAKDQPEYIPLRTLVSAGPDRKVISRWTLTEEQRKAVAAGADVFLELSTFGNPLQPIRMMVSDDKCDQGTNIGKPLNREWIKGCLLDQWPQHATSTPA